ncbi:DUF262 domain-containing protein [Chrysiogenes arsenatis]|uniref:DUF262 domain-containing protein n=1 Tax=Chrysiogenes arsenatis TaxID=309797 RepID=UPI000403FE69|nr:DUF262 domain-containing protein [Chrysiogenes arsenatis]
MSSTGKQKNNTQSLLEGETGLERGSQDVYPDATVKVSVNHYSVFELKRMVEETDELQFAHEFQSKQAWKADQKCELIESILMGIPISVVYVFEDENGTKQMVDGKQRIGAIIDFMNNRFTLNNLKLLPHFDQKSFKDLEPLYKGKIERYQVLVYVIEPPTPERVKYDIFDRVNRSGTQLNSQEMRNALYQGAATSLLKTLSASEEFRQATGNGIKPQRMRDQYIILRFLAFYLLRQKQLDFTYKSNIDDFLAAVMKHLNRLLPQEIEALQAIFKTAMQQCYTIMGVDAFRFASTNANRRPINMALYECLSYFFAIYQTPSQDNILKARLDELKSEFDACTKFKTNVDSSTNVEYRFSTMERIAQEWQCSLE